MARKVAINILYLSIVVSAIVGYIQCSEALNCEKDPCHCEISEDEVLDISNIGGNLTNGNLTYYFFGCKDHALNGSECKNTTLCLENRVGNKTIYTNLGNTTTMKLEISKFSVGYDVFFRNFRNGGSRINLVCAEHFNNNVLAANNTEDPKNPILYLFSQQACILHVHHNSGMSTGGTLVTLFLVGFILYFVGGAVVLYFIRGARGREMIPNIDFWQNLPGLVKDGLVFILNGCRPTAIATAESYDRI